jgi:hypothetical protein
MNSTDETIVELNKGKIALLTLASCAFVAGGARMLSYEQAAIRSGRSFGFFYNSPAVVYGFGLAAVLFFGAAALFFLKKLFDSKPGMVFNNLGVVGNTSLGSTGLIPWPEVLGAEVFQIQSQKMLIIKVRDPRKYIERGNALRRAASKSSHKNYGSPIVIATNALKADTSELLTLFDQYQRKYGG